MSYSTDKLLASSQKEILAVLTPAIVVTSWTNVSSTIYYNDFDISDKLIEYVSAVTSDGASLSLHTSSSVSNGQYYWDWDAKRLYINVGTDPASKTIVVFFELYFGTRTYNTYRDPLDSSKEVVYFAPRIRSASIPKVDQKPRI